MRVRGVARSRWCIPPIAAEFGLKVTVGAWIDKNQDRNEREIRSALDLARHNSNVNAIIVGNETMLRTETSAEDLIKLIQRVKRSSPVPVSTAELCSACTDHPELASAVDFIAAHILPYWAGSDAANAVDSTFEAYDSLRRMHPGKRIVIAEFGWPSAGYNFHDANPGRIDQAVLLRDFVTRAEAYGIDYNVIEAIDQPWKTMEGGVGPYWGLLDASRQPKFSWTGPVTDPEYIKRAGFAVLIGLFLSLPIFAIRGVTTRQALTLAVPANIIGAWAAAIIAFWKGHYFVPGAAFALGLGMVLLLPLLAIALARIEEIAAIAFGGRPRRLIAAPALVPEGVAPKVSIHIPAYCEPPDMLIATLDAVARLEYPNFECVLVINNTPDPAMWRLVEEHCRTLGDRFKFVRVEGLTGFKAGALRLALSHTAKDAEIIAVIDADYVVESDWLKDLVPQFTDPQVGLVQAPQDHRDGGRSVMHHVMNAEYAGFFDIGMVQRNEVNAIIVHGTMCLIRRTAMDAAGGWSSDTICEDSDLGLTILELGWRTLYTNRRYGWGLLPQDYLAFRTQRARWAGGAVQIVKKHWRRFLPGRSQLDHDQKREFAFGWLSWFGVEIIAVAAALLNLIWVPFVVFQVVAIPDPLLLLPSIAAFLVSLLHFVSTYRTRVAIPYRQMLGAMVVFMSVQWTVASAAFKAALPAQKTYFHRTRKGGGGSIHARFTTIPEAALGSLLVAGGITVLVTNIYRILGTDLFAAILIIQSLPFLSAVATEVLERFSDAGNSKPGLAG